MDEKIVPKIATQYKLEERKSKKIYCDVWVISRKRMDKHVATESLIPGNQLITGHGFHGYGN
jgi:hypothetical protein